MGVERSKIRWNGWGWAARRDATAERDEPWAWLAGELGMPALLATPARPIEEVSLPPSQLDPETRSRLVGMLGEDRVREDRYERLFHAMGRSYHDLLMLRAGRPPDAPDAVLYPRGTDEVLTLLELAARRNIAVTPFGGGTSVVAGANAARGGFRCALTLDLSGMDRVLDIDSRSRTATVEAGIYGPNLESALHEKGLTLGHFPQSYEFSSLGGWIAHGGAGQNSDRYGRARDWLVGAKLATPRGLIDTRAFPASSAGPDLNALILGSEGAFGIVTEATVRLRARPRMRDYRGYLFPNFEQGAAAIRMASQQELSPAMLRLSDANETRFFRGHAAAQSAISASRQITDLYLRLRRFDSQACAMISGFEGEPNEVEEGRRRFAAIAGRLGAISLGKGIGRRWLKDRFYGPYLRDPMLDRGVGVDTLETSANWTNLESLHAAVCAALRSAMRETAPRPDARGVVLCHISHSYIDGASLYFTVIFPRLLDDEIGQWRKIKKAASDAIVSNGGTISHHHGVGLDHLPWIEAEKGALGIDVLRAIKRAVDPQGVLNPGKLIPG